MFFEFLRFIWFFFPFFKKIGFLGILGPPFYGISATIRIGREMHCLPYAGFFNNSIFSVMFPFQISFISSCWDWHWLKWKQLRWCSLFIKVWHCCSHILDIPKLSGKLFISHRNANIWPVTCDFWWGGEHSLTSFPAQLSWFGIDNVLQILKERMTQWIN